jgi:hypothetical protein
MMTGVSWTFQEYVSCDNEVTCGVRTLNLKFTPDVSEEEEEVE